MECGQNAGKNRPLGGVIPGHAANGCFRACSEHYPVSRILGTLLKPSTVMQQHVQPARGGA
jgi:hypothetical protein